MKKITVLALALLAVSCIETTPAERVRYGIAGIKLTCSFAEEHPERVPPEFKRELDEICPVVAMATAATPAE